MTEVRRAFHTLKGSSRMVGLGEFGEAAWACEQLYNSRLSQTAGMDTPLRHLTHQALDYLGGCRTALRGSSAAVGCCGTSGSWPRAWWSSG